MKINKLEDGGKIIDYQSTRTKDVLELIKTINGLFEDGYTIDEDFGTRRCPQIFRFLRVKFIKKEVDIDSLKKKDELLAYAESNNVSVPSEITSPLAIKKFLKKNTGLK